MFHIAIKIITYGYTININSCSKNTSIANGRRSTSIKHTQGR